MGRTRTRETDLGGNGLKGWQTRGGSTRGQLTRSSTVSATYCSDAPVCPPVYPVARCNAEIERARCERSRSSQLDPGQGALACPSSGPVAPACRLQVVLMPLGGVPGMPRRGLDGCVALAGRARGAAAGDASSTTGTVSSHDATSRGQSSGTGRTRASCRPRSSCSRFD